ncbi:DnaB-like helicase N-terminal domain-containing protein [Streptomyces sp. NPDC004673]
MYYAERALLGALLLEPLRLSEVTRISSASFSRPAHAAVFTAILAVPPPDERKHPGPRPGGRRSWRDAPDPQEKSESVVWLGKILDAGRQSVRGVTAPDLHDMIQSCPAPRHISAYARIVEAEHARRRLRTAARQLTHTARDRTLPAPLSSVFAAADALADTLDDLAACFPPHPGSVPRTPASPASPAADRIAEEDVVVAAEEERMLLATATAHPEHVQEMRWLSAEDFTYPLHAGLWQCLTALVRRGEAVDPVTVLWEAQQRGLLDTETDSAGLLTFLAGHAASAPHWGTSVLQRAVLATAADVGRRVEGFTDDPANTPYQLVIGARRALNALTAIRARWQHTTSDSPTPAVRGTRGLTTAAPRAGPPRTTPPAASCPPRTTPPAASCPLR